MRIEKICIALVLSSLAGIVPATAEASCFTLVSELQRSWMEVRRYLVPGGESVSGRPDSEQFVCVSNYATRTAIERKVGTLSELRCFRQSGQGLGFCCDRSLNECAGMNPSLFPEHFARTPKQKDNYEPPKSDWVRPPGEGDQWNSN